MTSDTNLNGANEHNDLENAANAGSVFRAVLVVIMLLGIPVIGYLVYLNLNKQKETGTEVEEVVNPTGHGVSESSVSVFSLADISNSSDVQFRDVTERNCYPSS